MAKEVYQMSGELHGVYLPETNDAYTAWVTRHPHGYVINAAKSQTQAMYWHRADCMHIGPADGWRFVGDDHMKACALDPGDLAEWAKPRPEALHYCRDCRRKSEEDTSASV